MKSIYALLCTFVCLAFVSCTSSPQTRIEKNPLAYSKLNESQKSLVQNGQISQGMPKDGVFLALGKPDQTSLSSTSEGGYEQWDYFTLEPVTTYRFNSYYGQSWGDDYCGRRRSYGGFGWGPTIHYLPKKAATIRFENEKVSEYRASTNSLYR